LSAAAWSGHRAVVELLLHRGLGDQTLLRQTSQALIYAIERGHTEVAKVIVTAFPHTSTNLDIQKMAIFESTRTRDLALVKWLVQRGANINAYEDGESLLDVALSEGDLAIVETLLDEGIDTHQTLRSTSRVIKAHATEKLRLIIKLECNMEQVDEQGQTVLHTAALCGSLILVKLLLDSGVSVGGRDKKGHTALHHAVRSGNIATVKLLSDHELRPSIQDLMEACEQASVQIVDYLLRLGLDASSILNGRSAIHHVLCKRDPDNGIPLKGNLFHEKSRASTISLLIEMGADVNYKDSMGNTALHHSCNRREKRVTKVLLDCGAELDQVNGNGDTPLDLAVAHGDSELTLLLLNSTQLGLRANNTTWKNALKGGNFDAVQCLFADGLFLEPQSLDPQPSAVFEYFLSSNNVPDYFSNAIGLLKKLGVVTLSDVRVETENAYSFPNSIKESFEDITGTLWNWWPLQDPIPALRHDEAWVLWKHASYDRRACRIKVPLCDGENIKDLQSYITKLEHLHLPHYPKSPSLDTPILKHDPNTPPLLRLRAPYQFTVPEGSENSPSVRHSALNGQDEALELQSMRSSSKSPRQFQRRDSLQSQLPDQPDQTQSNTNEDQDHGRFVLCMPKPLLLEHIDMRLIKNDSQFLDDLLQRYRGHRGFFKKFFSIMRFHHWGFDKYTVFERRIHPTSTGSKMDSYLPIDAPHDREYDFKRVDIGESPPIPQRVFYRHCLSRPNRLYRTLSGLNIRLGRRYRDPERGDIPRCSGNRELVDRVPKRYRQWLLDSDEFDTAFGLSAFELPSLLGFMCYSICIFLITIVFGALWISVWGHPADLQNATIPAVAFVMLWIFMYQGVRGKPWNRDEDY
ncbi:ankyrin repeat-containing domain protein, partial [Hypoxylon argillaceum]